MLCCGLIWCNNSSVMRILQSFHACHATPQNELIWRIYQTYMAKSKTCPCKWPPNTKELPFCSSTTVLRRVLHLQLLYLLNPQGGATTQLKITLQNIQRTMLGWITRPFQHPYRASSCSGTQTQILEVPWRNPPPSSPPTRTTACHWQQ